MKELLDLPDNLVITCDAGAYGAETRDGFPIQKPDQWVTNSELIAEQLTAKLTPEQKFYAKKVEGSDTKRSGGYCDGLASAVLTGLQQEVARLNPQRFHKTIKTSAVLYVQPVEDPEAWQSILDAIEKRFENTYKRPFEIYEADEPYSKIQQLVPWNLTKVQASWTPNARRHPTDVPFTHRGCAMKMTTGGFRLEHEDLGSVNYPNQRFTDPIRVGLFFFGFPPDEEETFPTIRAEEKEDRATGVTTDIYFEGATNEPTDEIIHCQTSLPLGACTKAGNHPNSCSSRQTRLQDPVRT